MIQEREKIEVNVSFKENVSKFNLTGVTSYYEIVDAIVGIALLVTLMIVIKKISRNEHNAYNYLIWWIISVVVYIIIRTVLKV